MKIKSKLFFLFLFTNYKQWFLLQKIHGKNGIEVIIVNNVKWLNEKHLENNLGHSNLSMMTLKYPNY